MLMSFLNTLINFTNHFAFKVLVGKITFLASKPLSLNSKMGEIVYTVSST